ncbi:hypothetical protein D3C72_2470680 [compost metagenome]
MAYSGVRLNGSMAQTRARKNTNGTPEEFAGDGTATAPAYSGLHRSFQLVGACFTSLVL